MVPFVPFAHERFHGPRQRHAVRHDLSGRSDLRQPRQACPAARSSGPAARARAQAWVTIFHQCYRELCGLEAQGITQVYNYIHLIGRSMGLAYEDEYKAWKKAGASAAELIGEERIAKVGVQFFERALLPELKKRPNIHDIERGAAK
ncbi:MAG: hypothetical protein HYS65_16900 [Betaproteobacteria bacterium]|nr:hypothetical protein [Betaproteobacteria bacterium]